MSAFSFLRSSLLNPAGLMKPWMRGQGQTFREVISGELNDLATAARQVADSRNVAICDATVLPAHAIDRRIRRYTTESEASWRKRLAAWLPIHQSAGGAWCILRQLRIFLLSKGRPRLAFVSTTGDGNVSNWFTLAPGDPENDYFEADGIDSEFTNHQESPANWNWDGDFAQWSRFWILIYTSGLTSPTATSLYDDVAEWDSGSDYWDGYFTSAEIADMVQLARDWKAAGSDIAGLFLVHDDSIFDPTGSGAGYPDGTWNLDYNRRGGVTYSYER